MSSNSLKNECGDTRGTVASGVSLLLVSSLLLMTACSANQPLKVEAETETVVLRQTVNELEREPVPGTVNDLWVEPMHDRVCPPGQIDPSGMYYRKSHCTIAEIRRGKYQQVQYPDDHDGEMSAEQMREAQ